MLSVLQHEEVADSEVIFLLLHFLASGPCQEAAAALEAEACRKGLLPTVPLLASNLGTAAPASSYAWLKARYGHIQPDAIKQMLSHLLGQKQAGNLPGVRGLQSLLSAGPYGFGINGAMLRQTESHTALCALRREPLQKAGFLQQLLARETLGRPSAIGATPSLIACKALVHQATFRGHRLAVYCCTYDRTGARIITGSDDWLVKIWCARTGALLKSCRGHEAEITDFAVSYDNTLLASGALDHKIRVWSLQADTLGWPIAVLRGHTGPVSYLDFSPVLPCALFSCSADGTCRLWDARGSGSAACVLTPSPRFAQAPHGPAKLQPAQLAGGGAGGNMDDGHGPASATHIDHGSASASLHAAGRVQNVRTAPERTARRGQVDEAGSSAAAAAAGANGAGTNSTTGVNTAARAGLVLAGSLAAATEVSAAAAQVLQAAALASGTGAQQGAMAFVCCAFSPCGAYMLAGGTDASVYIWHWELSLAAAALAAPTATVTVAVTASSTAPPDTMAAAQSVAAGPWDVSATVTTATATTAAAAPFVPEPGAPQAAQATAHVGDFTAEGATAGSIAGAAITCPSAPADGAAALETKDTSMQLPKPSSSQRCQGLHARGAGLASAAGELATAWSGRTWPTPSEYTTLAGHTNDVIFILFCNDGCAVATGSRDGSVKIWRQVHVSIPLPSRSTRTSGCAAGTSSSSSSSSSRRRVWRDVTTLTSPVTEADLVRARARRRPPPVNEITQLVWNRDDSRVVAAVTDHSVRVWRSTGGEPVHILKEVHTGKAHVMEAHPTDPRVIMTGGYDGLTVVWDIILGKALAVFNSQDTLPLPKCLNVPGRWAEPFQLVDGHFSPDGSQLVVTDTAGQHHLYGLGPAAVPAAMAACPYDQFTASDYSALTRDLNGWVLDTDAQMAPHRMEAPLVDSQATPYAPEVQDAYRSHRLAALGASQQRQRAEALMAARAAGRGGFSVLALLPQAVVHNPPTMASAMWLAMSQGISDAATQAAVDRAFDRHRDALEALEAAQAAAEAEEAERRRILAAQQHGRHPPRPTSQRHYGLPLSTRTHTGMAFVPQQHENAPAVHGGALGGISDGAERHGAGLGQGGPRSQQEEVVLLGSSSGPSSSESEDEGSDYLDYAAFDDEEDDRTYEGERLVDSDEDYQSMGDGIGPGGSQRRGRGIQREAERRRRRKAKGQIRSSRRLHAKRQERSRRRVVEDEEPPRRSSQRLAGRKRSHYALGEGSEGSEQEHSEPEGRQPVEGPSTRRQRQRQRLENDHVSDQEQQCEGSGRLSHRDRERERERGGREQRQRQGREGGLAGASGSGDGEGVDPLLSEREQRRLKRLQSRDEDTQDGLAAEDDAARQGPSSQRPSARPPGSRPRDTKTYEWLQRTSHKPDCYSPQLSDQVVYVREGHDQALTTAQDTRPSTSTGSQPWLELPGMRACEPCIIMGIKYVISESSSHYTSAILDLQVEPACGSPVAGKSFTVELVAPAASTSAEWLIPRGVFEAACSKCWRVGDRAKNFQLTAGSAAGQGDWYPCTIEEDALSHVVASMEGEAGPPGDTAVPSSAAQLDPYSVEGMYERFRVEWDMGGEASSLSPWELYAEHEAFERLLPDRAPPLPHALATAAAQAVEEAKDHDPSRLFHKAPDKYRNWEGRQVYYTAVTALPLGLRTIAARLQGQYYRSLDAVKHDMATVVSNAVAFNGANSDVTDIANGVQACFLAALERGLASSAVLGARRLMTALANPDAPNSSSQGTHQLNALGTQQHGPDGPGSVAAATATLGAQRSSRQACTDFSSLAASLPALNHAPADDGHEVDAADANALMPPPLGRKHVRGAAVAGDAAASGTGQQQQQQQQLADGHGLADPHAPPLRVRLGSLSMPGLTHGTAGLQQRGGAGSSLAQQGLYRSMSPRQAHANDEDGPMGQNGHASRVTNRLARLTTSNVRFSASGGPGQHQQQAQGHAQAQARNAPRFAAAGPSSLSDRPRRAAAVAAVAHIAAVAASELGGRALREHGDAGGLHGAAVQPMRVSARIASRMQTGGRRGGGMGQDDEFLWGDEDPDLHANEDADVLEHPLERHDQRGGRRHDRHDNRLMDTREVGQDGCENERQGLSKGWHHEAMGTRALSSAEPTGHHPSDLGGFTRHVAEENLQTVPLMPLQPTPLQEVPASEDPGNEQQPQRVRRGPASQREPQPPRSSRCGRLSAEDEGSSSEDAGHSSDSDYGKAVRGNSGSDSDHGGKRRTATAAGRGTRSHATHAQRGVRANAQPRTLTRSHHASQRMQPASQPHQQRPSARPAVAAGGSSGLTGQSANGQRSRNEVVDVGVNALGRPRRATAAAAAATWRAVAPPEYGYGSHSHQHISEDAGREYKESRGDGRVRAGDQHGAQMEQGQQGAADPWVSAGEGMLGDGQHSGAWSDGTMPSLASFPGAPMLMHGMHSGQGMSMQVDGGLSHAMSVESMQMHMQMDWTSLGAVPGMGMGMGMIPGMMLPPGQGSTLPSDMQATTRSHAGLSHDFQAMQSTPPSSMLAGFEPSQTMAPGMGHMGMAQLPCVAMDGPSVFTSLPWNAGFTHGSVSPGMGMLSNTGQDVFEPGHPGQDVGDAQASGFSAANAGILHGTLSGLPDKQEDLDQQQPASMLGPRASGISHRPLGLPGNHGGGLVPGQATHGSARGRPSSYIYGALRGPDTQHVHDDVAEDDSMHGGQQRATDGDGIHAVLHGEAPGGGDPQGDGAAGRLKLRLKPRSS